MYKKSISLVFGKESTEVYMYRNTKVEPLLFILDANTVIIPYRGNFFIQCLSQEAKLSLFHITNFIIWENMFLTHMSDML